MRLDIFAVGRMLGSDEAALIETYRQRSLKTGRQLGVDGPYITEIKERKGDSGTRRRDTGRLLKQALSARSGVQVMLDARGLQMDSRGFAVRLDSWRNDGAQQVNFILGGADGLTDTLRQQGDLIFSLGRLTWPHMLARVLLCEQIWRAISILANHPYHRD